MASLYNNKISTTYVGLIKTVDNAVINASLKELTDGSGNASGLYVNTAGDFKVTSILEWGSLKDTGEGITITKFVDEADGIASNDNDTTIPTSAAIKDYVDTKFAETDTLAEVLVFGNTTGVTKISVDSSSSGIDLVDDAKIRLGTGNDFEIYHDSATSKSIISESGASNLEIQAGNFIVKDTSDNTLSAFYAGGKNEFYFNSLKKLETTSDGATVTGGLTATGTSVFTAASFSGTITGDLTGDVTGDVTGNVTGNLTGDSTGNVTATSVLADGVTATTQSASNNSTKVATTAYVDSQAALSDTLSEVLAIGNTTGATKIEVDNTSGGIDFIDNAKARFGTGDDLEIYHDGSNSYINETGTGNLLIQSNGASVQINKGATENMAEFITDGAVNLYYDSVKKFETSSAGATVTGDLDVTGTITGVGGSFLPLAGGTMTGNTIHNDNVKSLYGTSSDLEIYHSGSHSYIDETGTGGLILRTGDFYLRNPSDAEMIYATSGGAVTLYHNNSSKLSTSATGIAVTGGITTDGASTFSSSLDVTGALTADGGLNLNDNDKIKLGTSGDFQIYHDGTANQILANTVGQSTIIKTSNASSGDVTALTITANGDLSTGRDVTIAGDLTVNGTTTTVNTDHFNVEDPLISMAKDNAANSVDIGFYGRYNDGTQRYLGLFSDASDSNKFTLFKGNTVEPTTTVDTSATGYARADLNIASLSATGSVTVNGNTDTSAEFLTVDDADPTVGSQRPHIKFTGAGTQLGKIRVLDNSVGMQFLNSADSIKLTISEAGNATFAGHINLADNKFLYCGNSSDLIIGHDGSNAYVKNTVSGDLYIRNEVDDADIVFQCDDGSGGVETYFYLDGSAGGSDPVTKFPDNSKIQLGTGGDADLYHDGTDTYFYNSTGDLQIINYADDKDIYFRSDDGSGGTTAYFYLDGSEVLTRFAKDIRFEDSVKANFGASSDLKIYHDGSHSYIEDSGTGNLRIDAQSLQVRKQGSTENIAGFAADGAVTLYYDNSLKLETTSAGAEITGQLGISTTSGADRALDVEGDGMAIIGSGSYTELMLRSQSEDTVRNVGAWHWALRDDVGGDNDDLKLLRFTAGSYQGVSLQISNSDDAATFAGNVNIIASNSSTGSSVSPKMLIYNEGAGDSALQLAVSGSLSYYLGVDNSDDTFKIGNASWDSSPFMAIDSSGDTTFAAQVEVDFVEATGTNKRMLFLDYNPTSNTGSGYIEIAGGSNSQAVTQIEQVTSGGSGQYGTYLDTNFINKGLSASAHGNINFVTGSNTSASSVVMTIGGGAQKGNVGIGVADPENTLQINHAANPTSIRIGDNTTDDCFVIFNTDGNDWSIGTDRSDSNTFKISDYSALGTNDRFEIDTSGNIKINGDTSINRNNETGGELLLGGTTDGGFVDFDSTNLQLNTQRDPNTGTFVNTAKSHAHIGLQGANGGSQIVFGTAAANNTTATTRMTINKDGYIGINCTPVNQRVLAIQNSSGDNEIEFIGTHYTNIYSNTTDVMAIEVVGSGGDLKLGTTGGNITINSSGHTIVSKDLNLDGADSGVYGKTYAQTSTDSTTSIVDTGIVPVHGAVYEVFVVGNMNGGGSNVYRSVISGHLYLATDYNGAVVNEISWQTIGGEGGGSGDTPITVTPKLLHSGTEYTQLPVGDMGTAQIRLRISPYNSSYVGQAQTVRITRRI